MTVFHAWSGPVEPGKRKPMNYPKGHMQRENQHRPSSKPNTLRAERTQTAFAGFCRSGHLITSPPGVQDAQIATFLYRFLPVACSASPRSPTSFRVSCSQHVADALQRLFGDVVAVKVTAR